MFFIVSNVLLFYFNNKSLIVTISIKQIIITILLQNGEKKRDIWALLSKI